MFVFSRRILRRELENPRVETVPPDYLYIAKTSITSSIIYNISTEFLGPPVSFLLCVIESAVVDINHIKSEKFNK